MYRLVILSTVIITALADVDRRECEKIFSPYATRCCKKTSDLHDKFLNSEVFKECFELDMNPAFCEHDLCIAKKRGYATNESQLDKKKFEEVMTNDFGNEADLLNDMKSKCFYGDIDKYGPSEYCEFIKMKLCISAQILNYCREWNNYEGCNVYQGLVQNCVRTIF